VFDIRDALLDRIDAIPEGTWRRCAGCGLVTHQDRFRDRAGVCPECGRYARLSARERIDMLADPASFVPRRTELVTTDPLGFVDTQPYATRLRAATARTGLRDAVLVGDAAIGGCPVVLGVMEFGFQGGSMGAVVGEQIALAAEAALDRRVPLVVVSSSGGARMQEGIHSLLQMAKTAAAVRGLSQAGIPFLSVLCDPVYGGVSASFAALGDVILAETGTRAGFAGPRVIEQTIRQKLPDGFQTAEFLHRHGHIDTVVRREALRRVLADLLAMFRAARTAPAPDQPAAREAVAAPSVPDAWDAVRAARAPGRPTALEYVDRMFTGFIELGGDRCGSDDPALIGGLAWLDAVPVLVLGHCKGRDTAENVARNFGMPQPAGFRKAMRLMRLAERFSMPVVTLVDTPGAYPGLDAEVQNQSGAIAETLAVAAELRVPTVTALIGEGGSGGALALSVGDRLLAQEHTVFSVISPEGCAAILFGDATRAPEAARALRLQAAELVAARVVDEMVAEPPGGAPADADAAARLLADALRRQLAELIRLDPAELLKRRQARLRGYGVRYVVGDGARARPALVVQESNERTHHLGFLHRGERSHRAEPTHRDEQDGAMRV
jgi:acetyl-CoA carboxylase carboxyl transferase subunit beta